MTEIVKACPLCGSASSALFDQREFRGQPVINRICRSCGLVYQSPRMTEVENQTFYESEYRLLYQDQEGPNVKDLAVQAARARSALELVRPQINSIVRMLDIGCSTGLLLKQFQDHYHCQVDGIELGNLYRSYAQSLGLKVFSSLTELSQAGQSSFSLVSMMHVLEHLPDPVGTLQNLHLNYLAPDGWLLLEVPNLYAHDCFETAHLVSFSAHSLTQVVQKAGYRVVKLLAHGKPRSELLPLYLTLLAQPDRSTHATMLQPEHSVKLKRQAGFAYRRILERLYPRRSWIPISRI